MYMYFQYLYFSNIFSYRIVKILYFVRIRVVSNIILANWLPVILAIFALFKNISPIEIGMILFYDNYITKCISLFTKRRNNLETICSISLYQHWEIFFKIKNYKLLTHKLAFVIYISFNHVLWFFKQRDTSLQPAI